TPSALCRMTEGRTYRRSGPGPAGTVTGSARSHGSTAAVHESVAGSKPLRLMADRRVVGLAPRRVRRFVSELQPHGRIARGDDPGGLMGLEELQGFDHVVRARLDESVTQLTSEFEGVHDEEHVRVMVDECAAQLSRGRVAAFVPTLAHRFARE